MEVRELGDGLKVSAIGIGCMAMSGIYGQASDDEGIAAIHRAIDLGVTLFDTAELYGGGHNEELLGRAIRGRRDQVVVATKFGMLRGEAEYRGSADYVRTACEHSLGRLGIETIDLYQQHRVDWNTPIEETVGALSDLVQEGKIRHIGLCEARPADLRRAAAVHPIATLQSEYSVLERTVEEEVLGTCEELGIGFLPFAPLMRGLTAGTYTPAGQSDDLRRKPNQFPRIGPDNLEANLGLVGTIREIADGHGATAAQVSLAWLLAQRPWIVPIPGSRRVAHVEDNAGASSVQLSADDLARLDALAGKVAGERYGADLPAPTWVSPPLAS